MYDHNRIKNHINGVESSSYELFGAHVENGGVYFSVYAPAAKSVCLCADFNDWSEIVMTRDIFGVWSAFVQGIGEGVHYKYRVYSENGAVDKTDPFGYYCEVRPDNASIVYDLDTYSWRDSAWIENRNKNYHSPLNIYEVHLGTWKVKDELTGDERLYKYEELKTNLIPYVRNMGYTHIEFMPLCEYPFDGSWGYQGTGWFAPTSRYGEPRYLMDLIDTCHINDIGVILDIVPVHFANDEHGLEMFDGSYMYESKMPELRTSAWGSLRFDYSKPFVQSFMRSSVNFWINKYHFDGIRFDAVSYLIYNDGTPDTPENDCGVWFIRNTLYTLNAYHPDVMFIAEDASCRTKCTAPVIYGGIGFDYMWNFGWISETQNYIQTPFNERNNVHDKMTYPMYYFNQGLFMLTLSHDEVANDRQSLMTRVYGDTQEQKFADLKTYFTYQITHPGKKLNFMGNELAEYMEWNSNQPLGWNLLEYPAHDSFHEYIRALNLMYKAEPALYHDDYDPRSFSWLDLTNADNNIFAYKRESSEGDILFVVLNFSPYEKEYWLAVGFDGCFREVLNSDESIYGGLDRLNSPRRSENGYLQLHLPPLAAIIIKPMEDIEFENKTKPETETESEEKSEEKAEKDSENKAEESN